MPSSMNSLLSLPGIIEIFGEAGSGKSQLCHYLSAYFLTIERSGKVLYLSIDDIYRSERLFHYLTSLTNEDPFELGKSLIVHHELDAEGLHHFIMHKMLLVCREHNVGLIVIDSLAGAFRLCENGTNKGMLFDLAKELRKIGLFQGTCVIITNQVSALIQDNILTEASSEHPVESIRPSLGLHWSNCVDHRFFIRKTGESKSAEIECMRSPLIRQGLLYNLAF